MPICLADIERRVGHIFNDRDWLRQALTHPSATRRGRHEWRNNQRLEFLGDRVLGLIMADLLFARFPKEEEGALSKRHAALVRRETLSDVAVALGIGDFLTMARSEEEGAGRSNPSILADALEALIGAIYLDGGFEVARRFVCDHWEERVAMMSRPPKDAKTALQEWAQARGLGLPSYAMTKAEGPAHAPLFEVKVELGSHEPTAATATSKRAAEQAAAELLLDRLTR